MILPQNEQENWKIILQNHMLALFYRKLTDTALWQTHLGSKSDLHAAKSVVSTYGLLFSYLENWYGSSFPNHTQIAVKITELYKL